MELIKLIEARKVLDGFADKNGISASLAYKMTKFIAKTEDEHAFYAAELNKLVNTYSAKDDDGNVIIPQEHIAEFNAAVNNIGHTSVEDPGIRFDLNELSELDLSMKQMYPLLDFINE